MTEYRETNGPPYGITWATPHEPVCQTGFVYETVEAALADAKRGPGRVAARGVDVDRMSPDDESLPLYARIESEIDEVREVSVPRGRTLRRLLDRRTLSKAGR